MSKKIQSVDETDATSINPPNQTPEMKPERVQTEAYSAPANDVPLDSRRYRLHDSDGIPWNAAVSIKDPVRIVLGVNGVSEALPYLSALCVAGVVQHFFGKDLFIRLEPANDDEGVA